MTEVSRWRLSSVVSASGKLVYECSGCGRKTTTPDKWCMRGGCGLTPEQAAEAKRIIEGNGIPIMREGQVVAYEPQHWR